MIYYCIGSSSFTLPSIDIETYFSHLYDERECKMPRDHSLEEELYGHTSKIKRTFASMVYDLQDYIEKTSTVGHLNNALKFLNPKKFGDLLANCSSVIDVFDKLSPYFSFFDFEIIKLLTEKLGSDFNKKKLKKYRKTFKEFSSTRVCQCPSDAFGDVEKSEKVFVFKTDRFIRGLTVEELQKLKYEICQILNIQLRLLRIEDGCVELIFRVLDIDRVAISEKQQQALQDKGVLSVSYGDFVHKRNKKLSGKLLKTRESNAEINSYCS